MDNLLSTISITLIFGTLLFFCALNLKFLIWLSNFLLGAKPAVPSILKSAGLNILMVIAMTVAYFSTTEIAWRMLGSLPNGREHANGVSFPFYLLFSQLATTWVLWKLMPMSFYRSLIVAFVQTAFMWVSTALLFFLIVLFAFAGPMGKFNP